MLKSVVFAGGGTGGHLYPGLAVADALRPLGVASTFVGTSRGIEATAVPEAGYPLRFIHARGLSRKPKETARAVTSLLLGCLESYRLLGKVRPQLVVATGGYVCAPVLVGAFLRRIPSLVLEQNAFPGKTNRLLARLAKRICLSYPDSLRYFPAKRCVITGNPVRREILEADRSSARARLGLTDERPTVLVTGASQGARSLNEGVLAALPLWRDQPWHILHLSGPKSFQDILSRARAILGPAGQVTLDYRCMGFSHDMASLYAASDLVVCRAGATTLAEVTGRGLPSVLVPYPFAAGNHQEKNAQSLVAAGAAEMIKDEAAVAALGPAVGALMADLPRLSAFGQASRALGKPDALQRILDVIHGICGTLGG
jgi:UDP-N-acetylglucosamine--N-acetylmuramyl-(pentapeptide) pyrophosphoryl-undecaprenol N-acetylglucosamine transferase